MTSIMEQIAEAEQKADAILEDATRTARERITKAKSDADDALAGADEAARKRLAEALQAAQQEGERIADEVTAKAKAETEEIHAKAVQHVPEAVASLMERIEAAV